MAKVSTFHTLGSQLHEAHKNVETAQDGFAQIALKIAGNVTQEAQLNVKSSAANQRSSALQEYQLSDDIRSRVASALKEANNGRNDADFTYGEMPPNLRSPGLYGIAAANTQGEQVYAFVDTPQIQEQAIISGVDVNKLAQAIISQEVTGKILEADPRFANFSAADKESVAESIALQEPAYLSTHLEVVKNPRQGYEDFSQRSQNVIRDTLESAGKSDVTTDDFLNGFVEFRKNRIQEINLTGRIPTTDIVEDYARSLGINDPAGFRRNLHENLLAAHKEKADELMRNVPNESS